MKIEEKYKYVNLTLDEKTPVKIGEIYSDYGHGGLSVMAIEKSQNGYTRVKYIQTDGSPGWYSAVTRNLREPDPLEKMIFYELFNSGFTGEVKSICDEMEIDSDRFYNSFMGYFSLGEPVCDFRGKGIHGYVVSTNGRYLHPEGGNENGKLEIEYIDQSGNISRTCSMARGVYDLGPEDSEILRKGLRDFGYIFDKDCMMIRKVGDLVFPKAYSSMEWKVGDKVYHMHTGRPGEIKNIFGRSAEVKFKDYSGIMDLKDLKYVESYR